MMLSWSNVWRLVVPSDVVCAPIEAASLGIRYTPAVRTPGVTGLFSLVPLLALAFSTLVACEEPKPADVSACELLAQEREACDAPVKDCKGELAECEAACKLGLECEDLIDPSKEPGASACLAHCAPKFTCDDGSSIPEMWKCDHNLDCADGEDEEQCK